MSLIDAILSLFGFGRLQSAKRYIASHSDSGLVRHYNAYAVSSLVEQHTGVSITTDEARQLVEEVRSESGWEPREYDTYFPGDEEGACI